ncbi:MAG TPA: hypothetical protein VF043_02725 [Ktedonobacteraceae bacterium]
MKDDNENNSHERALERVRSYAASMCSCPLSTKNIQMLYVDTVFSGKNRIEVGQILNPGIAHTLQERVVAIFATEAGDQFLVCTTHRGAWQDAPYVFGRREVLNIQESSETEKDILSFPQLEVLTTNRTSP